MIPHQFYQAISSLLLVTHMNHVKSGLICVPFSFTDLTVTVDGLFFPDFPIGEDFSATYGIPLSLGNGIVYNNSAAFVAVEGDPVDVYFELNGAYEGILTGDIGLSDMTVLDGGDPFGSLTDCMGYVDGTVGGDHHLIFDLDGVFVYDRSFSNFTEHGSFSFNVTGAMQLNIVMFPDDNPNSFCIPLLIGNPRLCTPAPSDSPTTEPTVEPTVEPTANPSKAPSESPTRNPSETPSESPLFMSTDFLMTTDDPMTTAAVITIDSPDDDTAVDDDSVDDDVIIGDSDDGTLVDIFDICDDALDELDEITSSSGESDDEAGEILLAICVLDCDVTDLCLTDDAFTDIQAGTLTECSCAIIECNTDCTNALTAAAYSWKTWVAFAWMISILSIS